MHSTVRQVLMFICCFGFFHSPLLSFAETLTEKKQIPNDAPTSAQQMDTSDSNVSETTQATSSALGENIKQIKLKPVTVTATRIEKPVTAIPNTVTILEREAITQQTTIRDDVQSILEHTVPGFGPSQRRLNGRAETFRGRNPLYLIDGVPQFNALRDGQRDGKTIDPFFLERIEVIHGSNALQGIGATGGVVSMITRSPQADGTWTNLLRAGITSHDSFNGDGLTYKLGAMSGKRFERFFDVIGGVTFHKRGLLFDRNGNQVGLYRTQGDTMDSTSYDLFFKAGFEPDEHQRFQVMVNHFNLERDGDFRPIIGDRSAGILTTTEKGDPSADVGDPAKNEVTTLSVDYRNKDLLTGELVSQFFYQDFSALFEGGTFGNFFRLTPAGGPFLDQSEIQSKKLGTKLIYAWKGIKNLGFTPSIGFDFLRDKSSQVLAKSNREWVPETVFYSYAPFAQFDYSILDRIHLTGGFRYIIAELSVDDFTTIAAANSTFVSGGSPTFQEVLPNGGLTVDITSWMSVYGSYAEGFTMPDVGRVLRAVNTPGQDVDSLLSLDPVVTRNIELGIDLEFSRGRMHVALYRSDTDLGSRLELDTNGIFQVRREKTRIFGLDFTGSVDVTKHIVVGLNYAWIQGEFDSDNNGKVDTELDGLNIAPNRLNIFTTVTLDNGLSGRVQFSHMFDRDFGGPAAVSNANFNGITLVDLFIAKQTDFGQFSLGIENLLDNQYVTYFSQVNTSQSDDTFFAGAGRTLSLFWQHEF